MLPTKPRVRSVEEWKVVEVIATSAPDCHHDIHHMISPGDEAYETNDDENGT